jgi:hypothetical protein
MKKNIFKILMVTLVLASGLYSCDEDKSLNPSVAEITPVQGASNELLTLTGSDLDDILTIHFETGNVKAEFNSNFNTGSAILFRVPAEAVPGTQNIILTNKSGTQFTVPFNVLGFASITDVSNYNFQENTEITLTGKNLADVEKVVFAGTETEVAIVSKSATSLTLKFPATTLNETTLTITNAAGESTTTQSFVAIDNAFQLFTDDYAAGYQDASWGPSGISTTEFKNGTASKFIQYNKGNWSQDGFGWTDTPNDDYKFLSFYIKGASADYDLYIWSAASPGGFDTFDDFKKITVPANVWTYFKIPVSSLKIFGTNGTTSWNQIGWRIKGPDSQDETFHLDDVILIK